MNDKIEVPADSSGADIVTIVTTHSDDNGSPYMSDNLLFIGNANETATVQAERAFVALGLKYDVEVGSDHLDNGYFEIPDGSGCVCISWPRIPCPDGDNDDLIIA